MKKFLSFFAFVLVTLSLTSCGNGIKKYSNVVTYKEYLTLESKLYDVDYERDFVVNLNSNIEVNLESIVSEDVTSSAKTVTTMKFDYEIDYDNQLITEKKDVKVKITAKDGSNESTSNTEKNLDNFYQDYEGDYKLFDRKEKTGTNSLPFDTIVKKISLLFKSNDIDLDLEFDENTKFFIDGNVYTAENIDEKGQKMVIQTIVEDNYVSFLINGKATEESDSTGVGYDKSVISGNIDLKLEYKFKKVNLKPVDVSDYNIV